MRIQITKEGIWLTDRWYRSMLIRRRLLFLVFLAPVFFTLCLLLALNRSTNFKWFLHHHPVEATDLFLETGRTSIINTLALTPPASSSELPTVELSVAQNTLKDMHQAIVSGDRSTGHRPGGDRPYFKAWFRDESLQIQKSKIAYRGLMHYHHWPEKPSLRVKIRKSDIARGQRYVELTRPKDALGIRHQLPEDFARQMEMVTTLNEPVRLFINRKYFGIYLRSYRAGEALALANHRMPGTFFKGDAVGPNAKFNLWESSANWDVYGEKDHSHIAHLEQFLITLREEPSVKQIKAISLLLNEEIAARFSAIMIVSGCIHTDEKHNQMYYLCSNQGLLEPVPWDPTCYEVAGKTFTPVDTMNSPLLNCLMRNPHWVHRRNQIIQKLIHGMASAESINHLVEKRYRRMVRDLKADAHLSKKSIGTDRFPISVQETEKELKIIKQWANAKQVYLQDYLNQAFVSIEESSQNPNQSFVKVFGTVAIKVRKKNGTPLTGRDKEAGKTDILFPGLTEKVYESIFQPERHAVNVPYVRAAPMVYLVDAPADQILITNAITGHPVQSVEQDVLEGISVNGQARTFSPSLFIEEKRKDVVLGPGKVVLKKDVYVGPKQRLIIHPGTQLILAKNVSLFSRGKVNAIGTRNQPIQITSLEKKPWGCFGISGAETAGSRIEHVKISNGSIGVSNGIHFKGMLSVYDCPDITLRHCRFEKNTIGDDCVNLAESKIRVENCLFVKTAADGLDLDMCTGLVTDCHFLNCGNDGLDMMTCTLTVKNSLFEGSGDKGISVGEETHVVIRDCHLLKCYRGMEVKDNSYAAVLNTTFQDNQLDYHSYRKKWLYPKGGSGLLRNCTLSKNKRENIEVKKKCVLTLLQTSVQTVVSGEERIHRVSHLPKEWLQFIQETESE
ncbi:hypothetical protein MNBD_PLANCTO02-3210 [hydrothermal vent metagenome]|uniref:Right handed beta helix domain-containing protein n=1 Tax=hydrothermal vent metagenome TaxID=652676 RepID=A0A3B1E0A3_9ZZZZ